MTICALLQTLGSMQWCVFWNKHTRTRVCKKNCSFAITNAYCKVFDFSSAGTTGYRSIDCTAVLNPFASVTVLLFTVDLNNMNIPTHWKTRKDWRLWRAGYVCYLFRKISSSRIVKAGFYLNACDCGIPRVRFETSGSLFCDRAITCSPKRLKAVGGHLKA